MTEDDGNEAQLRRAAMTGKFWDLANKASVSLDEMPAWGRDREIRADTVRDLLQQHPDAHINLRGAAITGLLDLSGLRVSRLTLESCRLEGVLAAYTQFGAVQVSNCLFMRSVGCVGAQFRDLSFLGSRCMTSASFSLAQFAKADFSSCRFDGPADFSHTAFDGESCLSGTSWSGRADFDGSRFDGRALFENSIYHRDLWFIDSKVGDVASFIRTRFAGSVMLGKTPPRVLDFTSARFEKGDSGPFHALDYVSLRDAVLLERCRLEVEAREVVLDGLQAREGVHLIVKAERATAADAEFVRRSILTGTAEANTSGPAPRLQSLSRAIVGDLVLGDVDLTECEFLSAHGLDKLRVAPTCKLGRTPSWGETGWRPWTARAIVYEEVLWRNRHGFRWTPTDGDAASGGTGPSALQVAGIYRDLRKGLEDSKDEPGAADFYYGEMEMRRLAGKDSQRRLMAQGGTASERRLLAAYWLVAGYGLRAGRALLALMVLLLACSILFMSPRFAMINPDVSAITNPPGPGFATALEFTARESLTLTRVAGPPALRTTGLGTGLDIALRLLAPLLLGLAALALRARTKR